MKVWIDQDLCPGDGLRGENASNVFDVIGSTKERPSECFPLEAA